MIEEPKLLMFQLFGTPQQPPKLTCYSSSGKLYQVFNKALDHSNSY